MIRMVIGAMTTAKNVSMVSIALAITASVRVAPAGPLLDAGMYLDRHFPFLLHTYLLTIALIHIADAKKTVKSVIRETVIANNATA